MPIAYHFIRACSFVKPGSTGFAVSLDRCAKSEIASLPYHKERRRRCWRDCQNIISRMGLAEFAPLTTLINLIAVSTLVDITLKIPHLEGFEDTRIQDRQHGTFSQG